MLKNANRDRGSKELGVPCNAGRLMKEIRREGVSRVFDMQENDRNGSVVTAQRAMSRSNSSSSLKSRDALPLWSSTS